MSVLKPHAGLVSVVQHGLDALLIALGLLLLTRFRELEWTQFYWWAAGSAVVAFLTAAQFLHLYES